MSKINPAVVDLIQQIKQHLDEQTYQHIQQLHYIEQCLHKIEQQNLDDTIAPALVHLRCQVAKWQDEHQQHHDNVMSLPKFFN